jgi:hypothetical protein
LDEERPIVEGSDCVEDLTELVVVGKGDIAVRDSENELHEPCLRHGLAKAISVEMRFERVALGVSTFRKVRAPP